MNVLLECFTYVVTSLLEYINFSLIAGSIKNKPIAIISYFIR